MNHLLTIITKMLSAIGRSMSGIFHGKDIFVKSALVCENALNAS